jgi:hypothetical protein
MKTYIRKRLIAHEGATSDRPYGFISKDEIKYIPKGYDKYYEGLVKGKDGYGEIDDMLPNEVKMWIKTKLKLGYPLSIHEYENGKLSMTQMKRQITLRLDKGYDFSEEEYSISPEDVKRFYQRKKKEMRKNYKFDVERWKKIKRTREREGGGEI